MKLESEVIREATLVAEDKDVEYMKIHEEGMQILMENLSNLYRNGIEAVSRELISNALDTHARIGQKKPIEIRFPYQDSLSIKDYGTGLDREGIISAFGFYGASDKRDNNKERGGYGLGAKSGLAIAEKFTVISVKDGIKTTSVVSREEGQIGRVETVSQTQTSDANGTQVIVPISAKHSQWLTNNLHRMLIGYHRDQFIINDEPLRESVYDKQWMVLTNGVENYGYARPLLRKRKAYEQTSLSSSVQLSLGGVLYSLQDAPNEWMSDVRKRVGNLSSLNSVSNLILEAPISSVKLTPARDTLNYGEKTAVTVVKLLHQFQRLASTSFTQFLETFPPYKAVQYAVNNPGLAAKHNARVIVRDSEITVPTHIALTADPANKLVVQSIEHRGKIIKLAGIPFPSKETKSAYTVARDRIKVPDEWSVTNDWHSENIVLGAFQGRDAKNAFHGKSYTPSRLNADLRLSPIIILVPDFSSATNELVKKNMKDVSKGLFGESKMAAYILPADSKIEDELAFLVQDRIYTLDEFLEIGKTFRSDARKSAKPSTFPRRSVSYPAYHSRRSTANNTNNSGPLTRLYAVEGDSLPNNVVYYSQDEAAALNGARHTPVSTDWHIASGRDHAVTKKLEKEMDTVLGMGVVVFIPSDRSIKAFHKKFPEAVSYLTRVEEYVANILASHSQDDIHVIAQMKELFLMDPDNYVSRLYETVAVAEDTLGRKLNIPEHDRAAILSAKDENMVNAALLIAKYEHMIPSISLSTSGVTIGQKYGIMLGNSKYFFRANSIVESLEGKKKAPEGSTEYKKAEQVESMMNILNKGTME